MLYPDISSTEPDQSFRLTRISEIEAFLRKEVEDRRKMQKKYQRAVNITRGVSDGVGVAGLGMESAGIALVTTGVGVVPGIALAALGAGAFAVILPCGLVSRKCAAKASKHAAVELLARTKLNSVQQMISKALIDGKVSDEEFKLISDEVDRYHDMKEDIRSKARKGTDDEAAKKDRTEMRARLTKLEKTLSSR